MPRTEPSPPPADRSAKRSALARAAQDLDDLTRAYDECTRSLEDAEATVDALLDDPHARVLVVDGRLRVIAVSRGMTGVVGSRDAVLGRPLTDVVPESWGHLAAATRGLSARDGWHVVAVAGAPERLHLRRVSEDDRDAVIVVRHEPFGSGDGSQASSSRGERGAPIEG